MLATYITQQGVGGGMPSLNDLRRTCLGQAGCRVNNIKPILGKRQWAQSRLKLIGAGPTGSTLMRPDDAELLIGSFMQEDERCCGTGTCIIDAAGACWCGQVWDGEKMCRPAHLPVASTDDDNQTRSNQPS